MPNPVLGMLSTDNYTQFVNTSALTVYKLMCWKNMYSKSYNWKYSHPLLIEKPDKHLFSEAPAHINYSTPLEVYLTLAPQVNGVLIICMLCQSFGDRT